MKKYYEEYYSVVEKRTGRKIADCGDFIDAKMLLHLNPQKRQIIKNKFLMSSVIDIEIPKALPTTDVVTSMNVKDENDWQSYEQEKLPQIKLPESQANPVIV